MGCVKFSRTFNVQAPSQSPTIPVTVKPPAEKDEKYNHANEKLVNSANELPPTMPGTVRPSPEKVGKHSYAIDKPVHSANELVSVGPSCTLDHRRLRRHFKTILPDLCRIIQSSFSDLSEANNSLVPYSNGFVIGVIRAFQQDLHLILRPEDIWLSILTQFNFYVNAHAEDLREFFAEHEGKKEIIIDVGLTPLEAMDMGALAQKFTLLIKENIVDNELRDWIMPDFSTTTDEDKTVAAIVMMGTLQKYFEYIAMRGCGFPSVTLLGEKADWEAIRKRVGRLSRYGVEMIEWSRLLGVVLDHILESFEHPDSQETKDFWLKAVSQAGRQGSSDIETISGWIAAFCFWTEKGERVEVFEDTACMLETKYEDRKRLVLDEVQFPMIRPKDIPVGMVSVPVAIQDLATDLVHQTTMTAGSAGVTVRVLDPETGEASFQPRSGWFMLEESVKTFREWVEERQQVVVASNMSYLNVGSCLVFGHPHFG
jgi:hypothetical protein